MSKQRACALIDQAFAVSPGCAPRAAVDTALQAIAQLVAMLDAQRLVCAEALRHLSVQPDVDLAGALRTGGADASATFDRLDVARRVPEMGVALAQGTIVAGHLDRLGGALRRLPPDQQRRLLDQTAELVGTAQTTTVEDFARHLRRAEQAIRADDGQARLVQQRAAVRLRTWTDPDDGMHHWKLTMDPRTAVGLTSKLRAATEAMFHGGTLPDGAPLHWRERESFLRAHALIQMLDGRGIRLGRPEITVVEDRRVPPGQPPVLDWGIPVELPATELAELARRAAVHTVVLDGGRVVSAPGLLDLERTTRLASAAQRRVLRALYATCAIPGCTVGYDYCKIHHIIWWRRGGRTNLDNLIPVCSGHHHNIHDDGWEIHLGADRHLVVRRADGRVLAGMPNRRALTAAQRAGP